MQPSSLQEQICWASQFTYEKSFGRAKGILKIFKNPGVKGSSPTQQFIYIHLHTGSAGCGIYLWQAYCETSGSLQKVETAKSGLKTTDIPAMATQDPKKLPPGRVEKAKETPVPTWFSWSIQKDDQETIHSNLPSELAHYFRA